MFSRYSLLLFILCCSLCSCQSQKEKLHLFVWADYLAEELIEEFEQEFHCEVVVDTYDSNEALFAKLQSGAIGYDLVFPQEYFIPFLEAQDLLEKLEFKHLPNYSNLDFEVLDQIGYLKTNYSLPFTISASGLGYRKDRMNRPTSWTIFQDDKLSGRMTLLNDMREVLGVALINLGYSANTTNIEEIAEATELVLRWKEHIAKFDSDQYQMGLATSEFLVCQAESSVVHQIIQEVPEVGFSIPNEGTLLIIDTMAILRQAPNKKLAYKFLNFLLRPESTVKNSRRIQTFYPNKPSYALLPPLMLEEVEKIFQPQVLAKAERIQDVGRSIVLYQEAWSYIKSSP